MTPAIAATAPRRTRTGAVSMLAVAMAGWGTIGIFARGADASPLTVAAWRCVFAIGALTVLCLIVRGFTRSRFTRRNVAFTLLGGVALVANWVLLFAAYDTTTITITTVSYHAEPFFLVAIGALITRRRPSLRVIAWLAVAFAGLLLATRFIRLDGFAVDEGTLLGASFGTGAGLLYAVMTLLAKYTDGIHPQVMTLMQCMLGAVVLLPFADALDWSGTGWRWIAAMGVIHTGLLYWFLYAAARRLSTVTLGAMAFVNPAVGILTDILLTGTIPTVEQLIGIALIVAATLTITLRGDEEEAAGMDRQEGGRTGLGLGSSGRG
ncbi:drug/metabolite transporter (DMT)-like permease [Microbacterium resistens]|uniref:Drug/metabolite transporter (DMT)-like permease n=1 Tax=Microbacterium resistens TaxID=156977 RepID=A0ABU1SHC0_9MICO|nr:DMT family transporter [Microbacterium resistens]MDR6869004.1 drug/metabolite transporter (DMT)-like permease [Microbacterium resistens]